ncbi:MAG TPA: POTRA domain-containing protein, partial [Candidatus Baltobacteraceae bacterium]|nr:POTRA domain-containing protein [Candidatus Baltobacteraceae bacterium]
DVHALYGTGQFYTIRVSVDPADDGGVIVGYIVQTRLRVTDVKVEGNTNLSLSKIKKKITIKAGQPLDEQKLFSDTQEIKKLYEKYGYPGSEVRYIFDSMDEAAGKASVTFQITEAPRIKITDVEFVGASAFKQKELRKQLKTKQHGMFSWISHSDRFKQDQFEDDKETLIDFYHNHGYLDFEIKEIKLERPTPKTMKIIFVIYEGKQYKVGSIKFSGNKLFNDEEIRAGMLQIHDFKHLKSKLGTNSLEMDIGDTFTPDGLNKDMDAVQDFYGSRGYIDVQRGQTLRANRIPNVDTGTMDLDFQIEAGQKNYVERIDIRGNIKTKDKVIRRELAISPGEVF